MNADEALHAAADAGCLVWGRDVSGQTWPDAARTYLGDGTGVAWVIPAHLRQHARFVIDAEIVRPIRPSLVRRYGDLDPQLFARRWTRAEAFAKLADVPIITWLQRHRLDLPDTASHGSHLAWFSERRDIDGRATVITFAAALPAWP